MSINYPRTHLFTPEGTNIFPPSTYRLNQTKEARMVKRKTTEANDFPSSWLIGNFLFLCWFSPLSAFCSSFITNTTTIFKPPLFSPWKSSQIDFQFTFTVYHEIRNWIFFPLAFHARENGERFKIDPNYLDTEIEFGYAWSDERVTQWDWEILREDSLFD